MKFVNKKGYTIELDVKEYRELFETKQYYVPKKNKVAKKNKVGSPKKSQPGPKSKGDWEKIAKYAYKHQDVPYSKVLIKFHKHPSNNKYLKQKAKQLGYKLAKRKQGRKAP